LDRLHQAGTLDIDACKTIEAGMIAHAKAAGPRNISPALFALDVGVGDPETPHTLCNTDEQVLRSVALMVGASVGELAKELAQACGYDAPATSIFGSDDSATAGAAVRSPNLAGRT
jgi:hypothetical protein